MPISDASGLPIAANVECASPHEITLVKNTVKSLFIRRSPEKLIGDKAYDSDTLDQEMKTENNIDLISRLIREIVLKKKPKTAVPFVDTNAVGKWSDSLPGSIISEESLIVGNTMP